MGRIAIINPDAPGEIIANLKKLDIEPFPIPRTDRVEEPLSGHPDIQVFAHEERLFCHPGMDASFISEMEKHADVTVCSTTLSREYPADVPYNIACCGSWAFRHAGGADSFIEAYLESKGVERIGVSQGYAKCSTLVVDDNSIITADRPISRAAAARGIAALLIRPGHIDLPGYRYGFIGGATGLCGGMVLCAGTLAHHPDYPAIADFIEEKGKKIVPLGRFPAIDLGTILVL